jgi:DNA-binding SARP family transcriptional activator/ABC-type transport system substrate-binding protein/streptogramin lyase
MEFWLLGPLEVREDGQDVPIGGAKQRALLVLLLLNANEVVSRDRLIDELWRERPPGTAEHSLDHQVSRLRKLLAAPDLLVTKAGGYVLRVAPDQLDITRFEQLLAEGRRANAAGDPSAAAETLRAAIGLWRGPALADLEYEPFARNEIERLEELRVAAREELVDAELALGNHQGLVAELESLTGTHPLRERLRAQLMLALYRSGRQAEALRVYSETRRQLVDDLGIEPSQELRKLQQSILRQDASLAAAPAAPVVTTKRQSKLALAALALVLAAAATAAGLVVASGGTQSPQAGAPAEPDSVVLLSVRTGKAVGQALARGVVASKFGAGSLWSLSSTGELTRIAPASGKVLATLNTGVSVPCGLAVGEGAVWVTDCTTPTLVQIDPSLDPPVVANRFPLPVKESELGSQTHEVTVGAGSVWVGQGNANPSYVHRLDPRTGHVKASILIPEGGAQALTFGNGALWVANADISQVSRIDSRTNRVTATPRVGNTNICCLAAGGSYVWVATNPDHQIWKLDAQGAVTTSIELAGVIENVTYSGGAVWAAEGDAGRIVRIDPTTNQKRVYPLGHHVAGVAAANGVIAVGVQQSARDATAGLKGRVVQVALKDDYLDWSSPDPAATQTAFNPYQVQFQYATCAKLYNYLDAAGTAGAQLVPEVAADWPTVSDAGHTYSFRIRPGYRFSPPSNEPVTAASFAREIDRVLSPRLQTGPWKLALMPDVVGAPAYHAGRAPHVSGVSVHGDLLVIRLVTPASDLPARLADPDFCAVPVETPIVLNGVASPIPSAGPYYLAAHAGDAFVLKRNPNYHGPRPQRLDAIVYRTGVDLARAVAGIANDKVDYVAENDPALAPGTPTAHDAASRYRLTPNNWPERLVLNPHRPLFADVRIRRAVAYALDRRALAAALAGGFAIPTSGVLSPTANGAHGLSTYPLGGDLAAARRFMGGRRFHAVVAEYADPAGVVLDAEFVRTLSDQLAAIGIRVTVLPVRQTTNAAQRSALFARADIVHLGANASETRDPVEYLRSLPYLRSVDQTELRRLASLPSPRREAAAASLGTRLERDAIAVGVADRATPELVSSRLGCVIDQPKYPGVDLAALCLPGTRG